MVYNYERISFTCPYDRASFTGTAPSHDWQLSPTIAKSPPFADAGSSRDPQWHYINAKTPLGWRVALTNLRTEWNHDKDGYVQCVPVNCSTCFSVGVDSLNDYLF